jgi:hypothetical protein
MKWDKALEDQWLSPGDERMRPGQYVNEFPCYFLWRSLVLNSNGKVARCLVYQNVAQYAYLNQMSVMEAYNHPSVQAARSLFGKAAMTQEAPSPCNSCGHYERLHGPLPAKRRPMDMSSELPRVLRPRNEAQRTPATRRKQQAFKGAFRASPRPILPAPTASPVQGQPLETAGEPIDIRREIA